MYLRNIIRAILLLTIVKCFQKLGFDRGWHPLSNIMSKYPKNKENEFYVIEKN
jgi:hypothetical protein